MSDYYSEFVMSLKQISKGTVKKCIIGALFVMLIILASIIQPVINLSGGLMFYVYFISGIIILSTLVILAI